MFERAEKGDKIHDWTWAASNRKRLPFMLHSRLMCQWLKLCPLSFTMDTSTHTNGVYYNSRVQIYQQTITHDTGDGGWATKNGESGQPGHSESDLLS